MTDQIRASASPDHCALNATALSSPMHLLAQFIEQYLVRRPRVRVVTTVTVLALFAAYVLRALSSISP